MLNDIYRLFYDCVYLQQAQSVIALKEKEIAQKDELIDKQQTELDRLFENPHPILKDYDFIIRVCERIRIPFDIVKQIFSGKAVS